MFGSKSSDIYFRIYDKALERGLIDGSHWIRLELVLKQDRAAEFLKNSKPLGTKFRGVISNYFRFVEPSETDSNIRRWKTCDWWNDFLDNVDKISLFTKKDVDYNLSRLDRYVFHQSGNSIETYIRCVGFMQFISRLQKRDTRLSTKHKYLIEQCKMLIGNGQQITEQTILDLENDFRS